MHDGSKMVQNGGRIRRQGAQDFMAYYDCACARQDSLPLTAVKINLDKGMLDFNGDRLKLIDWPPVLAAISINKHLQHIAISSTYQASLGPGDTDRRYYKTGFRKKIPAIRSKDMTFKLCKAIRECLTISSNLKILQLNGLPLRERDLVVITKGLAKSVSLENLSLANCLICDEGLQVICQSVKYSSSIKVVDFTGCNLTWRGAEHMANIIKHQSMQRHGTAWAESLRYRQPRFETMGGLRRITLNCNTLIGDRGAAALAQELTEDLWVKAVDLQRCGLSNVGPRRLLEALKINATLCVLDIRNNPLVDKFLIKTILEKVLMNSDADGPSAKEYSWIKPAAIEPQRAPALKKQPLPRIIRGNATLRTTTSKGMSGGRSSGSPQIQKSSSRSCYVPWRAAARAGRERGQTPAVTETEQSFQGAATVKIIVDSESEEGEEEEEVTVQMEPNFPGLQDKFLDRLQMELRECRLKLAEERRARLKAESRLMKYELENAHLRDANHSLSEALAAVASGSAPPAVSALDDEAVLQSIESSFTQFHAFLDLLKDTRPGQLLSVAGIDSSDFQPLGGPPLSSTKGTRVDGSTKTDALPLNIPTAPGPLVGPAETTTPRSALLEGMLQDLSLIKSPGPALIAEKEPVQHYSESDSVQRDSESEHSIFSQRSYNRGVLTMAHTEISYGPQT